MGRHGDGGRWSRWGWWRAAALSDRCTGLEGPGVWSLMGRLVRVRERFRLGAVVKHVSGLRDTWRARRGESSSWTVNGAAACPPGRRVRIGAIDGGTLQTKWVHEPARAMLHTMDGTCGAPAQPEPSGGKGGSWESQDQRLEPDGREHGVGDITTRRRNEPSSGHRCRWGARVVLVLSGLRVNIASAITSGTVPSNTADVLNRTVATSA